MQDITAKIQPVELGAAITGLRKAREQKAWQGVRPQGAGESDEPEPIPEEPANPGNQIISAMKTAQARWPDASTWEVIGAEDVKTTGEWEGAQTYAEFSWPALTNPA